MENIKHQRVFHGKIILFGEYSIIEGSSAALVPYTKVKAQLVIPEGALPRNQARQSNRTLRQYALYLAQINQEKLGSSIDVDALNNDLEAGMYLESSIPAKYGLGSSGAICAALYHSYGTQDAFDLIPLEQLRILFSHMESFFHGSSSGIDPLCAWAGEPLIVQNNRYYLPGLQGPGATNEFKPFLIDTGRKSNTAFHVKYFRDKMQSHHYKKDFTESYLPLVNRSVEQWSTGKLQEDTIFNLSKAQQLFLDKMFPAFMREVCEEGLKSGIYAIKLCGSGGGGMMLGFTKKMDEAELYLNNYFGLTIEVI